MDSEDSRDGNGDARSSSSSSSSSSRSRSRRSSSSDRSARSKKDPKLPPESPQSGRSPGLHSPSPDSRSQSPVPPSNQHQDRSSGNLSAGHSDINSPENSMPASPLGPKSPCTPKSSSDAGSNPGSPTFTQRYSPPPHSMTEGPKTPQSPNGSVKSPQSPPGSPDTKYRPASPDSQSQPATPASKPQSRSSSSSPSPDRNKSASLDKRSPIKNEWSPKEKWRRHTKAEQKMVQAPRSRSRSESSQSSVSSYNKRNSKEPGTEEISEGEMESDEEEKKSAVKSPTSEKQENKNLNISHEDLSDVSDLESMGEDTEKQTKPNSPAPENKEVNVNGTQSSPKSDDVKTEVSKLDKVPREKTSNTEDGEEQLDFEAEEGECVEPKAAECENGEIEDKNEEKTAEDIKPGKRSRGSSLEEGEVSDEAERRPEESEPRPVCRFFARGACTWGVSCRFLHPGVTDKGNYNMFDVIRGVPSAPARDPQPPESAWERGLRTAKEMLRIANKRKEQDMDFEEKKLHLSVGGAVHDPDAELAYAAAAVGASPPRHADVPPYYREHELRAYGPMYRGRFPRPPAADERERYYERERPYEHDRPYERMPPHFEEGMPEDASYHKRRVRSSREVIVQRAEVERREGREGRDGREGRGEGRPRGDEWADPWMRAEPAARRRRPPSSDDSYSSTSSSNSSSRSSRSPGTRRKRRASSSSRQRLSPSVIVRERRLATARATAMNPPAPRRRALSPATARQAAVNPPPPASFRHKEEMDPYGRNKLPNRNRDRKKYSRSSSSGSESSSSSSESESDSRSSSTSGSSGARRARHARLLNAAARPRLNAKSNSGFAAAVSTVTGKKESSVEKEPPNRKRSTSSPSDAPSAKKPVSRREELLKQLKAVEDAIARKRSKI